MAALPLPVAILDDLISGTGNEVIQDGDRKRKGRHFPPPPQWGSKNAPYTTDTEAGFESTAHINTPDVFGDIHKIVLFCLSILNKIFNFIMGTNIHAANVYAKIGTSALTSLHGHFAFICLFR